ncbi:MAG: hypothetical protein JWL84_5579 [Rhodospirillales bacterium]|jgi:hypothetical protein|nr:hypothetical protein [Rhodospirillales bacterium]
MRDRSIEGDEIGAHAGFDGTQHVRLAGAASATHRSKLQGLGCSRSSLVGIHDAAHQTVHLHHGFITESPAASFAAATGKEWIVTVTFGSSTDAEVDRPDRPASDSPLDHCKAHIHQNAHGGDDE